jgi:hypothetical protein
LAGIFVDHKFRWHGLKLRRSLIALARARAALSLVVSCGASLMSTSSPVLLWPIGPWFTLEEAKTFSNKRVAEAAAARISGRIKPQPERKRVTIVELGH